MCHFIFLWPAPLLNKRDSLFYNLKKNFREMKTV